ncbi:MAG: hypothetical protein JWO79_2205, partial [Actinomycetia bacterium]|nr:hypothetical protein [Actinomycetes bacterium]
AEYQAALDLGWQRLCGNDPHTVMAILEEAFDDNEAPAATVNVSGDEVSLLLLVPSLAEVIPERWTTTTPTGRLSLKKLTQRDRADYYKLFVCGQLLVTVREALAVAPAIASARIAVVRNDGADAYGKPRVSCLLAARFGRERLDGVQWDNADAAMIVNDVSTERVINQRGRSNELAPIDLTAEPELAALIDAVDLGGLIEEQ